MAIDTTYLDAGSDKIKPARAAILAMAQEVNLRAVQRNTVTADTTGAVSAVAAFQAAIDLTPSTGVQVVHIPRGAYLGNMLSGLTPGSRAVVLSEEGGVSYPTAEPSSASGAIGRQFAACLLYTSDAADE